jgi:hypothetical protein
MWGSSCLVKVGKIWRKQENDEASPFIRDDKVPILFLIFWGLRSNDKSIFNIRGTSVEFSNCLKLIP